MKYLILLLTLPSFSYAATSTLTCKLNQKKTDAKIEQELKKHPEKRNNDIDDGAIVASDLDFFSLVFEDGQYVGGHASAYMAFNEQTLELTKDSLKDQKALEELDAYVDVKVTSLAPIVNFNLNVSGWDNYNYKVKIDIAKKQATARATFDFTCGGNGSVMYAVYDCEMK